MKRIIILNVSILLLVGSTYACNSNKDATISEKETTVVNEITEDKDETWASKSTTADNEIKSEESPITSNQESTNLEKDEKVNEEIQKTTPVSKDFHNHKIWDELTKKHVTEKGFVDYKGMIKDSTKLNKYLQQLSANHPNDKWTSDQQKAFWINAYNAFTVKLIVDNYPVESIKDLGGSIYRVNTPWDIKFINIGDNEYHLNDLEHNILRKQWDDARIHAVVNCAAKSCPRLRDEAYIPEKLNEQLDDQMKKFIEDERKNIIKEDSAKLSKLFKWYSGDFKNNAPSIIAYINKYSETKLSDDAEIDYMEYDWSLNEK